ncbi:hypothetical protein RAB80_006523 [Fusarium oxysporum f. sp. vasinfectum]|nr:hypothetical protein RAB80_006523 [Fusarium oxysporum f. sp. vasinfectum]KAK2691260.1 hypothetical protein QWA68_009945 [Fusarium oxysporum]KAK2924416.1 hypothetical protein FoTM2_016574 [Fusarium oxysporum f. sp. vasinfectum]
MIAEIPESITYAKPEIVSPIKHLIHSAVILSTTITSNEMAEPETPLTPPAPDDGSYEGSDVSDEHQEPRLTPDELGALFIDFYTFLTTLKYDKSHLKIPPPTGWPELTPESCAYFKSDYAIEVIRHLLRQHLDVVCIAVGHESFSRELWLNVKDCDIFEDFHAGDMLNAVSVEVFFENMKEQYKTLKLIPGRRRITIEAEKVPEHDGRITEKEVTGQTEEWGTDLNIQYARQIYRDHGWPGSFDLETASEAIDKWLEPLRGGLGGGPRGLT